MSSKNSRKSGKSKGGKETNPNPNPNPNPFTLRGVESNVSKNERSINNGSKSRNKAFKDK